jgi:hypothetical protein
VLNSISTGKILHFTATACKNPVTFLWRQLVASWVLGSYYYYYWWGGTESLGICSSP